MALTLYGKEVRMCRIKAEVTLAEMAGFLRVTPAFLSAVETGRKRVPDGLAAKVREFFEFQGLAPLPDFEALASASNEEVSLVGLQPEQQMLVAALARSSLDSGQIAQFTKLLQQMGK